MPKFITVKINNGDEVYRINTDHIVKYTHKRSDRSGMKTDGTVIFLDGNEKLVVKETPEMLDKLISE